MANRIPFLTGATIESLLNWERLLPLMENAMVQFSANSGRVVQPQRTRVDVSKQKGFLLTMPAYVEGEDDATSALACKMVTVYPENKTVPSHHAQVILFDHRTGSLQASFDGEAITRIRTAAASAIATKYLASCTAKSLGIIGAGTEARSHLQAFSHLFPNLEQIFLWSRRRESCVRLADEQHPELKRRIVICGSADELASRSDVICTVTMATEPVLRGAHVRNGAHINAVGAPSPNWRELDEELARRSEVYVDSRESAEKESGDIILNKATIRSELGQLISQVRAGAYNRDSNSVTIFKSCGIAIEDAVAARFFYDQFKQQQQQNGDS